MWEQVNQRKISNIGDTRIMNIAYKEQLQTALVEQGGTCL